MYHREKEESLLREITAGYFNLHTGTQSIITITRCELSRDSKYAKFFISVMPEDKEAEALNFAKRHRPEIREYIKDKARLKTLPHVDIEIDYGEKNRQRIEGFINKI